VQDQAGAAFDIAEIDRRVIQLFALVGELVTRATLALLTGDREQARSVVRADEEVDARYHAVESLAWQRLDAGTVTKQQMRYLIAVLHMLPELERSGDLAEHIASRAARGIGFEMSARSRGLVERMGEVASSMWRMAADAFGDRAADAADRLDRFDDEMDALTVTLTAAIVSGEMGLPVAVEVAMIGRFYERLGDHAVNLARRVRALTVGAGGVPSTPAAS